MYTKLICSFLFVASLFNFCHAQEQSNKGMDFWLGYGAHAAMFNSDGSVNSKTGGSQDLRLYLQASGNANVTVSMPAIGWSQTLLVSGFNTQVVIPKIGATDARLTGEGVFNGGIHISSDQPITAFAHLYDSSGSASTLLLPFEILEQEYYAIGFKQKAKENNSFSYCFVVATADSTLVEVIPSADTKGHLANVPFTQLLRKGQVLNLIGKTTDNSGGLTTGNDLTGTYIHTIGAGKDTLCKKIAVFSGSSNTLISCADNGKGDNLFQQDLPTRAWGSLYLTAPTKGMENNYYRVFTGGKPTIVSVNGTRLAGLINGMYYEFQTNLATEIRANQPVVVAQYITSAGECNNNAIGNLGDPDMVFLSPINFGVASAIINVPKLANISQSYVNVVLKTAVVDSFMIDTFHKSVFFKPLQSDTIWSYAQIPITPGIHTLHIDTTGFAATVYGYGNNESYAFDPAFYITRLSSFFVRNPYLATNTVEVCKTIPFKFVFLIKKNPVELIFDFANNPYLSPNSVVDLVNPIADSAYVSGQDTSLWQFTLPGTYTYAKSGPSTFIVNVTEFIPTPEGCIEKRIIKYTFFVTPKPVAGISLAYNICSLDTLHFKDSSSVAGSTFINWFWNFGDGSPISNIQNPFKNYANYGDYTVKLRSITSLGCYADTFKTISRYPKPVANYTFSGLPCTLDSLIFTDSSKIPSPGIITKRLWDFGDNTTATNTTNYVKQYSAGGTYNLTLLTTSDKNCTDTSIKKIKVFGADTLIEFITVKNAYPGIDTPIVCRTEPFSLAANFNGKPAQIHWDFTGNPNLTPNNNVDLLNPVPDSVYTIGLDTFYRYSLPYIFRYTGLGPFNLNVKIYEETKGGCLAPVNYNNIIQGVEKPAAYWARNYDSCSKDTIFFKDLSTDPSSNIVLWKWAFGDNTFDSVQNPIKKYAAYGSYQASLKIITSIGCYADTTSTITLSPKPVGQFGINGTLFCPNAPFNFIDSSSIETPGNLVKWLWSFGDGASSTQINPSTKYAESGTYNITLMVFSNHNCIDTITKAITIYSVPTVSVQPLVYIGAGLPYQISPLYTGTGLAYMWVPSNYLNNDTLAYPTTVTDKNILYTVTVTGSGGCQANASINVRVERLIEVPNVFSPNGDGINDKWIITNIEGYQNCVVRIFNRYGQLLFNSIGYNTPWDGTFNGQPVPIGTYYYIIDTKVPQFPGKAGYVELLR